MGLVKYIANIDEIGEAFKDGVTINATADTIKLEKLLEENFKEILFLLEKLFGIAYIQSVVSFQTYIPAVNLDFEISHIFNEDVRLTGIMYSQTAWKTGDNWSLYVDDVCLFENVFTKELGEHKYFNSFYEVKKGSEVKIIYHNVSGNSKQVWFDLELLKAKEEKKNE